MYRFSSLADSWVAKTRGERYVLFAIVRRRHVFDANPLQPEIQHCLELAANRICPFVESLLSKRYKGKGDLFSVENRREWSPNLPTQGLMFKRSTSRSNWNLWKCCFCGGKKTGEAGEKPSEQDEKEQQTRVSRGDWLRNAANFRRPAFCFDFDVERRSHVTMKVHKFSRCRTIYLCLAMISRPF